jgi:formylglycine-generating enzyme required for sulfatase activity
MKPTQSDSLRWPLVLILMALGLLSILLGTAVATNSDSPLAAPAVTSADEVYVPEGPFSMGCSADLSPIKCDADAHPVHSVYVDAFYVDRTEVTNSQYAACVGAGACREPLSLESATRSDYFTNPAYADFPVLEVDWDRAKAYCRWVGRRLPTEAEWEKAARGTDVRWFPWGNDEPDCSRANFAELVPKRDTVDVVPCEGDTVAVGSYPTGASPYGALDMVGNVREWVQDLYESRYYFDSPYYNPQGPASTDKGESLVRGGSWADQIHFGINTWVRIDEASIYDTELIGFRCARSTSGPAPTNTPRPSPLPTQTPVPTATPFSAGLVGSDGGLLWLAYPEHLTVLHVPSGAVGATTTLTLTYDGRGARQDGLQGINHFFSVAAQPPLSESLIVSGTAVVPLEVGLGFDEVTGLVAGSLDLYRLSAAGWSTRNITVVEKTDGHVWALIQEPGTYGLLGRAERVYLPVVLSE